MYLFTDHLLNLHYFSPAKFGSTNRISRASRTDHKNSGKRNPNIGAKHDSRRLWKNNAGQKTPSCIRFGITQLLIIHLVKTVNSKLDQCEEVYEQLALYPVFDQFWYIIAICKSNFREQASEAKGGHADIITQSRYH